MAAPGIYLRNNLLGCQLTLVHAASAGNIVSTVATFRDVPITRARALGRSAASVIIRAGLPLQAPLPASSLTASTILASVRAAPCLILIVIRRTFLRDAEVSWTHISLPVPEARRLTLWFATLARTGDIRGFISGLAIKFHVFRIAMIIYALLTG